MTMGTTRRPIGAARPRRLLAACAAALCGMANAGAPPPQAAAASAPPTLAFSRPAGDEVHSPAVLRAYLRTKDEVRKTRYAWGTNHFCFVKQAGQPEVPGSKGGLWMIWREGREVLGGANGGGAPLGEEAESLGRAEALAKSIDLATDVVPTPEDIAGSTFLVDRAWVDRLTAACMKTGRTVTVAPARAGAKR